MKKKLLIAFLTVMLAFSTAVGVALASGKIKIVVNGQEIKSDVAPRMINNRVMVPISFVSKALGANVSWDQKSQTVTITGKGVASKENVWKEELDLFHWEWASIRKLVASYVGAWDFRDEELMKKIVTKDFGLNVYDVPETIVPWGGITGTVVDYEILDARSTGDSNFEVRVEVIEYGSLILESLVWDIQIKDGLIDNVKSVTRKPLDSYTVFPGLTYKYEYK